MSSPDMRRFSLVGGCIAILVLLVALLIELVPFASIFDPVRTREAAIVAAERRQGMSWPGSSTAVVDISTSRTRVTRDWFGIKEMESEVERWNREEWYPGYPEARPAQFLQIALIVLLLGSSILLTLRLWVKIRSRSTITGQPEGPDGQLTSLPNR